MRSAARVWLTVGPLALAAGGGALALVLTSGHEENEIRTSILGLLVGWSFVIAGLIARTRRPENRTGALLLVVGLHVLHRRARGVEQFARLLDRARLRRDLHRCARPPAARLSQRPPRVGARARVRRRGLRRRVPGQRRTDSLRPHPHARLCELPRERLPRLGQRDRRRRSLRPVRGARFRAPRHRRGTPGATLAQLEPRSAAPARPCAARRRGDRLLLRRRDRRLSALVSGVGADRRRRSGHVRGDAVRLPLGHPPQPARASRSRSAPRRLD